MPKRKEMKQPTGQSKQVNAPARGRPAVATTQSPPRNWRSLLYWGGGLILVGAFVAFLSAGAASEKSGVPDGVVTVAVGEARHVEGEIDYDGHPAGGEHNSAWLNCGAYSEPVAEENAVHSLEHGAVWITYEAGDANVDVGRLVGYAGRNKVLVSPVDSQEAPVLVTAWARQMETETADDPRINQFIVEFAGSADAPEPGGLCSGGVGQPG